MTPPTGAPRYRPSQPVLTLAAARLIGAIASYMVFPFVAVRLVDGGAGLAAAGLVAAAGPAAGAIAGIFGGMAADGIGRRNALIVGNLGSALAMAGFAFSHGVLAFALLNALNGVSRAVARPASSAIVADVTAPHERAEAYAYGRVAMNVGAALGPFLGAFFVLSHPEALFLGAAGAEVAICLMFALLIAETGRNLGTVSHREVARRVAGDSVLWLYMVGGIIQFGTYMIIETIFPAFLKGAVSSGLTLYAAMSLVNTALVAIGQIPLNRRLGGLPKGSVFAWGLTLFAAAYVGFTFLRLPIALLGTMIVFTAAEMVVFAVMPAFEAELGDDAVRGRVFGLLGLKSFGAALWPLGAGALLQVGGARLAFPVVAIVALAGAYILRRAVRLHEAAAPAPAYPIQET